MALNIGAILEERYRIDSLVGEGGMGAVYRAHDARLNETVALKENLEDPTGRLQRSTDPSIRSQIEKNRAQFGREAFILSELQHPGLPQVREHFEVQDQGQYLVMDFVEGQDLQTLLQQARRLPADRVIEIGIEICGILEYIHSRNPPVIHRDIKPSNLRMTPAGRLVLVDFGIFKEAFDPVTRTAARAVSEGFSPLEMYHQSSRTDARSDVYSLGATLFAALTGRVPPSPTARVMGEPLPSIHDMGNDYAVPLAVVLDRSMSLNPSDRHQTATELKCSLEAISLESGFVSVSDESRAREHIPTRVVVQVDRENLSPQNNGTGGSHNWIKESCETGSLIARGRRAKFIFSFVVYSSAGTFVGAWILYVMFGYVSGESLLAPVLGILRRPLLQTSWMPVIVGACQAIPLCRIIRNSALLWPLCPVAGALAAVLLDPLTEPVLAIGVGLLLSGTLQALVIHRYARLTFLWPVSMCLVFLSAITCAIAVGEGTDVRGDSIWPGIAFLLVFFLGQASVLSLMSKRIVV